MFADLVANRGFDFKLAAGRQAKSNIILYAASDSAVFGYARSSNTAHANRTTNDVKNR
jgi:hypothetical protein